MANLKHINACISVNDNLQITCVPSHDIEKYLADGYIPQTIMVKASDKNKMPDLTAQEEKILNLFMQGKSTKEISYVTRIDDSSVCRILANIRAKFNCNNNILLALKVQKILGFSRIP